MTINVEQIVGQKEEIIAKLHTQLGDEIKAHDETKAMLREVKIDAEYGLKMIQLHERYITKIVEPLIVQLNRRDY